MSRGRIAVASGDDRIPADADFATGNGDLIGRCLQNPAAHAAGLANVARKKIAVRQPCFTATPQVVV